MSHAVQRKHTHTYANTRARAHAHTHTHMRTYSARYNYGTYDARYPNTVGLKIVRCNVFFFIFLLSSYIYLIF